MPPIAPAHLALPSNGLGALSPPVPRLPAFLKPSQAAPGRCCPARKSSQLGSTRDHPEPDPPQRECVLQGAGRPTQALQLRVTVQVATQPAAPRSTAIASYTALRSVSQQTQQLGGQQVWPEHLASSAEGGQQEAAVHGGTQALASPKGPTCLECWVQIRALPLPGHRTSGQCFISSHLSCLIYTMEMMARPPQGDVRRNAEPECSAGSSTGAP